MIRALLQGAIVAIAAVVAVVRFFAIDSTSHSNSDTIRPWAMELVPIVIVAAVAILAIRRIFRSRDSVPSSSDERRR